MKNRIMNLVSDLGLGTWDLRPLLYLFVLSVCLILIVRQYGGWNVDTDRAAWRREMARLRVNDPERAILARFHRVQALNRSYRIGVVSVTDYRPAFGGEDYRVYDIGYYDWDKRVRLLVHITCRRGRLARFDDATP